MLQQQRQSFSVFLVSTSISRYWSSLNRDFQLPVRMHRVQFRPVGLSDYPKRRLRRYSEAVVPPKPPDRR